MTVPAGDHAGQSSQLRLTLRVAGLAALWAVLTGGEGWIIGIPAILLAAWVMMRPTGDTRWSLVGIIRFIPYFLWNSLYGAIDVAVRALHPARPIDPAVLRYEIELDDTTARVLMANTVTLLPGTLSADLDGRILTVHVLNRSGPVTHTLKTLERRIAGLYRHGSQTRSR